MVIIIATAVPPGLRGHVTRWLFEIAPGVFAGHVSARVRDQLWERVCFYSGASGKALMVWSTRGEQRMQFRQHRYGWAAMDFDGVTLMARPRPVRLTTAPAPPPDAVKKPWEGRNRSNRRWY